MNNFKKSYRENFATILLAVFVIGVLVSLIASAGDEFVGLVFAFIFGGIASIAVSAYVALDFYEVAEQKGYTSVKYFLYPLLLGMVGYLLIMALKDNVKRGTELHEIGADLPEI